jgi:ectoine hydroxylase-related dioxygenase (phytanoyl-CoA dioxygenase family)
MSNYEYTKYVTNKKNVHKTLNKYGVAIIPNVITKKECKELVNGMWDFFEHITKGWDMSIDRDDEDTWRQMYELYPLHSMLIQHWNIGHSQFSWDLRQKEKIVDIFAKLWKCKKKDLLVSFDGASFNMPPEVTNRGWNRNNTWYHSDQSFTRNNLECVQSWITGLDVNDGDATLAVMEGSHKYHKEFAKKFKITDKFDWYKLNEKEEKFFIDKGCKYNKIMCPKGSLVLWDSRTIHCGSEALKTRKKQNFRAITYLCYLPRKLATAKAIEKKKKAFNEMRTTSHWPNKPKLFPKTPRTYGKTLPSINKIDPPILTELGKKLAGF